MLVFETNRPDVLDPAVQSRCTQSIEFIPPSRDEVRKMLDTYVDKYIRKEHEHRRSLLFFWRRNRRINCDALTPVRFTTQQLEIHSDRVVDRSLTSPYQ